MSKYFGALMCLLLALQFGFQPYLASTLQSSGLSKVFVVMSTEFAKVFIGMCFLFQESEVERNRVWKEWTFSNSVKLAALPAVLFAIQNVLIQESFGKVDGLTFNLVNQTKVS